MKRPLALAGGLLLAWLLLGGNVQQAINFVAISTGVTGLGTGVATALGVNVGSTGAFVTFNGALGTPSSGTATNLTGLPLAGLATQATNTVVGNATSGTAAPTALAVGTCSTAGSALNWTTNTGFGCNTSITAAAVPASGITGTTLASGVTASSLTSVGTLVTNTTVGLGTSNPNLLINGAASGTGGGPALTLQSNGSFAGAVGHYSNIFGGTYDASTALVSAGSVKINANSNATSSVVITSSTVALPTIASSSAAQTGTVCWTTGTGNLTVDTTTTCLLSGREFKHDIRPIDNAKSLATVMALKPSAYFYNDPMIPDEQIGLVADEVEEADARLVARGPDGKARSVRYQQLTADLAGAIQAQQKQIEELRSRKWCFAGWCR